MSALRRRRRRNPLQRIAMRGQPRDPARIRRDLPLDFFRGFLASPKQVGSVIPSSRFLEKRIVRSAQLTDARVVVELGPGTGGTTRALLRNLHEDATLLSIEINQRFVRLLRRHLHDPRLIVHEGSATHISEALRQHGLGRPDVILSGIPFSTMRRELAVAILQSVYDSLAPGGRFVAYQFRDRVETLGCEVFGRPRVQTELFNVPPMRVYHWRKTTVSDGTAGPLPV